MRWFLLFYSALAFGQMTHFDMRDAVHRNSILVISEAPFERTIALSHFLTGSVDLDPENLAAGIKGQIEFDTRSFDTGLELRNTQLRDQFLQSAEFPTGSAVFQLTGVKGKLRNGETMKLKREGDITIRGVTRKLLIPFELTYFKESEETKARLAGNLLRVRSTFSLDTALFGISIADNLKNLFNKTVQVSVEALGSDRLPVLFSPIPETTPKAKK
jgi:polyisoprenoid-binding protein YceI